MKISYIYIHMYVYRYIYPPIVKHRYLRNY